MFTNTHIRRRCGRLATVAALLALASSGASHTTLTVPANAQSRGARVGSTVLAQAPCSRGHLLKAQPSYGWPVKPFFRQHAVRGFFGDPRLEETYRGDNPGSFHFGVDISAPDGAPVYATVSGEVVLEPERPETVSIIGDDGRTIFAYWHVVPSVKNGRRATAYQTVVGHIQRPWAHVHFAELRDGRHLNPLRPGAMGPYADQTCPTIQNLRVEQAGTVIERRTAEGRVDLVVEASDTQPLPAPAPWTGKPVTPALILWRLTKAGRPVTGWRTAFDIRKWLPSAPFGSVYARWTRQNHPWRAGRYRFYLARGLATGALAGAYIVEVRTTDTAGNASRAGFTVFVANGL